MKRLFVTAAVLLVAQISNAQINCNVSTGNISPSNLTFDQLLYTGAINDTTYVLVQTGSSNAKAVTLSELDTYAKLKAVNGATLVTFSGSNPAGFSITASKIDVSKTEQIFAPQAMAFGALDEQRGLNLILPTAKLSLNCTASK